MRVGGGVVSAFTHTPRAPEIPAAHPDQRYYCGAGTDRWVANTARVYRIVGDETANVSLRTAYGKSYAEIYGYLTAAELRDLAGRMLDAAHDLETAHPAVVHSTETV